MDISQLVGERMMLARRRSGLDQREVAARMGVSAGTVSRWELGYRGPDWNSMFQLAAIYGVPVSFFFEGVQDQAAVGEGKALASSRELVGAAA